MDYTGYKKSSKISHESLQGLVIVTMVSLLFIPVFVYGVMNNGLPF